MQDQPDHRRDTFYAIVFAIFIFVILWLRRPDSLLNPQFWAEDGGVFFREQMMFGVWGSLFRLYSGYIHAIPRILVALMCHLPVRWVPLGFNLSALLIEAVCCSAFFWPCYRKIIASDALRATCCVLITATVVAGSELVATLSNVQWYLCVLSLLLIAVTAGTRQGEVWLTVVQVAIAFTAPVTLLYAPFLAVQLRSNAVRPHVRPAVHLAALFAQGLIMHDGVLAPKPPLRFDSIFLGTLSAGLSRCILAPLLGWKFSRDYSETALFTVMALALAGLAALATFVTMKLYKTTQLKWLWSALWVALGSLLAILWGRSLLTPFLTLHGLREYAAERYFFVGACMFIFCLALIIDTFSKARRPAIGALILAALFIFGTVRNFSAKPFVDFNWKENSAKIDQWQAARHGRKNVERLIVPINPPDLVMVLE